jgi:hypothetical protein
MVEVKRYCIEVSLSFCDWLRFFLLLLEPKALEPSFNCFNTSQSFAFYVPITFTYSMVIIISSNSPLQCALCELKEDVWESLYFLVLSSVLHYCKVFWKGL